MAPNPPKPRTEREELNLDLAEMAAEALTEMKYPGLTRSMRELITCAAWLVVWHQRRTTPN